MMRTIGKHITTNFATFGLAAATDLCLIEKPKGALVDGAKKLIVLDLRTMGDTSKKVPFGNQVGSGKWGERFQTVLEIECKTRAADPSLDYYWNTARKFRDTVYGALAGSSRGGLVIPRKDWTDPLNPVDAGQIWFEVDPSRNSPLEDPIEDQDDPANKSIMLTYTVRWWRPI